MPIAVAKIIHFTKTGFVACAVAPLLLAAATWLALDYIFRKAELKAVYGGDVTARDRQDSKRVR